MSRELPALGRPPTSLVGFPRWSLTPTRPLYRAHRRDLTPWWFYSDLSGRFDLIEPDGTCYLASTAATALRERWGDRLIRAGRIGAAEADRTVLSRVRVPDARSLADSCSSRAALFGLTRELGTLTPYSLPQTWAAAFARAGCGGIRYESRFSTGPRDLAYAVFGPAGIADLSSDEHPVDGRAAANSAGISVLVAPFSLRTVVPPA